MFRDLIPVDGAIEGVKKLSLVSEIYIVTGRPLESLSDTMISLSRHFPDGIIKQHHFVKEKSQIVNKYKIDCVIDDGPHIAKDIIENTSARMFLMDKPYNALVNYPAIRVKSWEDFLEHQVL
jgi:5'(3')-deoxyribonucleotidase